MSDAVRAAGGSRLVAYLQIMAAALCFSTGGAAIKATALGSWQVSSLRSGIGAVVLFAVLPAARRHWSWRILPAASALAATFVLFVHANKATTAASAIFLQSTAPLYILLLAPLWLGERTRRSDRVFILALACGAAAFFIGIQTPFATAPDPQRGNVLGALSGFTWALTILGLRWLELGAHGGTAAAVVCGNALACLVGLPGALPLGNATAADWGVVAFLGLFQVGAAYVLLTAAVRRLTALEASLFVLLEPVLSSVWAAWLHGERPGAWAVAGGVVVIGTTLSRALVASRRDQGEARLGAG